MIKGLTKREAFEMLWARYDYCMMGYDKEQLYKSMSKREVLQRLKNERANND
jgi:hypothetical protein